MQQPINFLDKNFIEELYESFVISGYAIVYNTSFRNKNLEMFYNSWIEFFNSEIKDNYKWDWQSSKLVAGYEPTHGPIKFHEAFYICEKFSKCPSFLLKLTRIIYSDLYSIGTAVFCKLIQYYFKDDNESSINTKPLMKILHYPSSKLKALNMNLSDKTIVKNPPHVDVSYITVLPYDSMPGLQIFDKKWTNVRIPNDHLLIICGKELSKITNKSVLPLLHRVVLESPKDNVGLSRISTALFLSKPIRDNKKIML